MPHRVDPGRNGVFRWTLVAGSRVAGTGSRTPRTRRTLVEVTPFHRPPARTRKRAAGAFAARGRFAGTEVEVRWGGDGLD